MAKTTSQVAVTQGAGINLSTFSLTSGRRRQTVVLGDADEGGEELLAELPAHDSADRGSPLKIGGKANAAAGSAVAESDRTDAWFTLNGQLGTVTTMEPAVVYDGGRRTVTGAAFTKILSSASSEIVAAAPGLKTKVLFLSVVPVAMTGAGGVSLSDGSGGASLLLISYFNTTLGTQTVVMGNGGLLLTAGSVNTALHLVFSGDGTLSGHIVYYQAP